MKARDGQIAIYLLAVLVAIIVLVLMNVNVFLSVRAKNHATSAGDAAALAVANLQGQLLNRIGELNIESLKAAIANDRERCLELVKESKRLAFLGPLDGISAGNRAAIAALASAETGGGDTPEKFYSDGMKRILERHVVEIRTVYAADTSLYPEPWPGAWQEYARGLELQLAGDFTVGPENAEFVSAYACDPLLDQQFYNAIAGRMWCWFLWGRRWIFDCDSHNMPRPVLPERASNANSEIYSLHLKYAPVPSVLDDDWKLLLCRLAECSEDELVGATLLFDPGLELAFFDERWNSWSESGFNPEEFPIVGPVRPEYDVLGCAALCRVRRNMTDVTGSTVGDVSWVAGAKPFGTVADLEGKVSSVTSLLRVVTPAFTDVRLVPIDSVGAEDLHTADEDWMLHVRDHLPGYFLNGPGLNGGCWYCEQLRHWENPVFRKNGVNWLKYHSADCVRPTGGGGSHGGSSHAH